MTSGQQIRAIDPAIDGAGTGAPLGEPTREDLMQVHADLEEVAREAPERRVWPVALAVLATVLIAAWTTLFTWTHREELLAGATFAQWTAWLSQWSLPVLLIAVAWLIAMRSSAREAARFGDAAHRLAAESTALEARLTAVNRELSLARDFLAAQSRDLEYLGRSAAERICEHAGTLQRLIADNGAQVEAIAGVSQTALANMAELRDQLPVVANSARDVTNQIGGAGRSAKQQLETLVSGFERLNEFGQASERQVVSLRERIDAAIGELTQRIAAVDDTNAARIQALHGEQSAREEATLANLQARGEALQGELAAAHETRMLEEATALAAMRGRVATFVNEAREAASVVRGGERAAMELFETQTAALKDRLAATIEEIAALDRKALEAAQEKLAALAGEAEAVDERLRASDRGFEERLAQRRVELEAAETAALAAMKERAEALDGILGPRFAAQAAHAESLTTQGEALAARAAEIDTQLAAIVERSSSAEASLARGAHHFAATATENAARLSESEDAVARLTEASVRVLELIQAAAAHSRDDLPAAIAGFEGRLDTAAQRGADMRTALAEAREQGETLHRTLAEVRSAGDAAIRDLDSYKARLAQTAEQQGSALASVREGLDDTERRNLALAESVSTALTAAIERMKSASAAMLSEFEVEHSARATALADRIGSDSAAAIDRALEARTAQSVAKLDEATSRSVAAAEQAIAALRDQLARVHELTGNLEARATRAREQVEERVDSDFARRMALITESLNSHSIDIAKALSTEVTDTAWASYLKGDRGVFTRRAVKLVEGGDARAIAVLFETDHEFRDHVSRYIHDFEAMLRTMLSTRDGHALGVTLLSSDMGKLYVTLAQAIRRLRE
ncbi:ATPase [Qipengyuania sediminis]|uniref:ATPase n=1 Tax=Qipengyuania sediminis TaxID=1532023 RepID=UPI00105A0859|nr:ATPase [Qipengyuania sediminis]